MVLSIEPLILSWSAAYCLTPIAANHLPLAQGNYTEAEPLFRRSLAIRERALGPEHPGVTSYLNNLAGVWHSMVNMSGVLFGNESMPDPVVRYKPSRSFVFLNTQYGVGKENSMTMLMMKRMSSRCLHYARDVIAGDGEDIGRQHIVSLIHTPGVVQQATTLVREFGESGYVLDTSMIRKFYDGLRYYHGPSRDSVKRSTSHLRHPSACFTGQLCRG